MVNSAAFASQRLCPVSEVVTGSVVDSVEVVLQPANMAAASKVPNDASFQGMKPPFFKN
ncbi:hypothetical protein D3C84_1296540 [compost metagenome]